MLPSPFTLSRATAVLLKLVSLQGMSPILNPSPLRVNLVFLQITLSRGHLYGQGKFLYNLIATYSPNNITNSLLFLCLFHESLSLPNDGKLCIGDHFNSVHPSPHHPLERFPHSKFRCYLKPQYATWLLPSYGQGHGVGKDRELISVSRLQKTSEINSSFL